MYFLFLTTASYAQWDKIEDITYPYINAALFDGDNIFVGADSLYISRDKGLTWESKSITSNASEITVLFKTDNRTFAGTYGDGIYQSTNSGESWQSFNKGILGFASYAKDMEISGDTLYYGTEGGGVYFLKLDSDTWQSYNQNLPSNYAWTVNDLTISNTNIILSSGASGFYYLRPKGSSGWVEKTIKRPNGAALTTNTFLSVGDTVFSGSRWGVYRSVDNGNSWDSVGVRPLPLDVVAFVKDGERIYAGFTRASGNDFFVWYTDDWGDTWNVMDHQFQYLYKLYIYDSKIWAATNDGLRFNKLIPTSAEPIDHPSDFKLYQNYPNPFNPITKIRYSIPFVETRHAPSVQLRVYDLLGRVTATLVNKQQQPGNYEVEFNALHLSSGVYFYKLTAGEFVETKKMILMK